METKRDADEERYKVKRNVSLPICLQMTFYAVLNNNNNNNKVAEERSG